MKTKSRLELLEAELERFVEVASREFGAEQIILFGSLARAHEGAVGEWSDLDLLVIAASEEPFYERTKQLLERVKPKTGVDVFVYTPSEWERMKAEQPFIKEEVLEKGRVVYERVTESR